MNTHLTETEKSELARIEFQEYLDREFKEHDRRGVEEAGAEVSAWTDQAEAELAEKRRKERMRIVPCNPATQVFTAVRTNSGGVQFIIHADGRQGYADACDVFHEVKP